MIGTSPAPVVAVDGDGNVVLENADVDNVVAVEEVESSVESSVVGMVVAVAVLTGVSVRETGTTSIVAATESVVLVVFLNGASCRNWLLIVSLAPTM